MGGSDTCINDCTVCLAHLTVHCVVHTLVHPGTDEATFYLTLICRPYLTLEQQELYEVLERLVRSGGHF